MQSAVITSVIVSIVIAQWHGIKGFFILRSTLRLTLSRILRLILRRVLNPIPDAEVGLSLGHFFGAGMSETFLMSPFFSFQDKPGTNDKNLFSVVFYPSDHGQTLAYRTSLGPSFQL
jgi:hypothetical protein